MPCRLAPALLLLATLLRTGPARAQALPPGDHELSLTFAGQSRFFLLHVPPQAGAGRKLPLVLDLHGGGGEPRGHQNATRLDALADREGFLVAYPAGYARPGAPARRFLTFNAGACCGPARAANSDDVGFVRAVLAEVAARAPIDATRVYATGFSNGAMMSYRLARELSHELAAIAPVGGASDTPPPTDAAPVPILHIHSVDDPRALYRGGEGPPFPMTSHREHHPAVDETLRVWARHNGCAETAHETTFARADGPRTSQSGHRVTRLEHGPCASGKPVVHLRLAGPGHVWPGAHNGRRRLPVGAATDVIDANEEIWAFFRQFTRAARAPLPTPARATVRTPAEADHDGHGDERPVELPFTRSGARLAFTGARGRSQDARPGAASLALTAHTTLLARVRLGQAGPRAFGLGARLEARTLALGGTLPELPPPAREARFLRAGAALDGFVLTRAQQLFHLQAGVFVAEASGLLSEAAVHGFALGLARQPLATGFALLYGGAYSWDFGRPLPLPLIGCDARLGERWRLVALLPLGARLARTTAAGPELGAGVHAAGDHFRYRDGEAIRALRIARLRAGIDLRWPLGRGFHVGGAVGAEGVALDAGLGPRRYGGGYLQLVLGYGGGHLAPMPGP